jgi:hypothetical protein
MTSVPTRHLFRLDIRCRHLVIVNGSETRTGMSQGYARVRVQDPVPLTNPYPPHGYAGIAYLGCLTKNTCISLNIVPFYFVISAYHTVISSLYMYYNNNVQIHLVKNQFLADNTSPGLKVPYLIEFSFVVRAYYTVISSLCMYGNHNVQIHVFKNQIFADNTISTLKVPYLTGFLTVF